MEPNEPNDDELLARSLIRPEVLSLLYERHAAAVFRFLARRAGPAAADDLVGDVFVAALEGRVRYHSHESGSACRGCTGSAATSYGPTCADNGPAQWSTPMSAWTGTQSTTGSMRWPRGTSCGERWRP